MRPKNTQKKGFISSVAPCYHPLQFLIYIGPWCWEGSKTLVLICTDGFNFLVDIIISKPGRVLRRSQGNQGAYSVRSPRCNQTLGLQSQRKAEDNKNKVWILSSLFMECSWDLQPGWRGCFHLHWKWCREGRGTPRCCPTLAESSELHVCFDFVGPEHLGQDLGLAM